MKDIMETKARKQIEKKYFDLFYEYPDANWTEEKIQKLIDQEQKIVDNITVEDQVSDSEYASMVAYYNQITNGHTPPQMLVSELSKKIQEIEKQELEKVKYHILSGIEKAKSTTLARVASKFCNEIENYVEQKI
jgi:hypothetical protein